jgi:hypothetical protein
MALQTLRLNSTGPEVEAWENFLAGQGFYWVEVDGKFNQDTHDATIDWQKEHGLTADGAVGAKSFAEALKLGFPGVEDTTSDEAGPNWPSKPSFGPLSYQDRAGVFGTFSYQPAGTAGNPEAIKITDNWPKDNITVVEIPQLVGVKGAGNGHVSFHKKGAKQLQDLWKAWEEAGLLPLVLSWEGAWAARYVRGSRTYLSNHSFGSAFDINYKWNPLGAIPALIGKQGSVRKLIQLAHEFGFYWGGHFKRLDGMHFEIAKIIP